MTDGDQPLEPDPTGTPSALRRAAWMRDDVEHSGDIPVVDAEEMRQSVRASRVADAVRCDLPTAIASLTTLESGRVAIVTPDDEANLGGAVAIARALCQSGPTVVVDMAAEARASRDMAGLMDQAGLKDVLAGEAKVSDCIFNDQHSSAHIMPTGRTEAQLNPASVELLPVVLDALQQGYKYLLIDAGGADAGALERIVDEETGIVVCTAFSASDEVDDRIVELRRSGFEEPVIVEFIQPQAAE